LFLNSVKESKQPEDDHIKDSTALVPLMEAFASKATEEWEKELANAIKQAGKLIAAWFRT